MGKTTTSAALAAGLSKKGAKVLGVDLDPQGNLGFCLGLEGNGPTVLDALQGRIKVTTAIRRLPMCDVLASDITLSSTGIEQLEPGKREIALRDTLAPIRDYYDYIIVDTPPALNILTVNAYVVSDYIIIPMNADILSLVGLSQLRETIDSVKQVLNPKVRVMGILLNRYNKRTRLSRDVLDMANQLAMVMDTKVFEAKIRNNIAIAEAPAHGKDIFTFAPKSLAVKDFLELIEEITPELHLKEVIAHGKQ